MLQNSLAIALAYFQHWLKKEDLYSQQSPFIFSLYQGLLAYQKKSQSYSDMELNFAPTIFSTPIHHRINNNKAFKFSESKNQSTGWSPRKKAAFLCSYFCQTTAAKQVVEVGTGNGTVTRLLGQVTKGNFYTFSESDSFESTAAFSSNTTVSSGFPNEKTLASIQALSTIDFVVIHPQFSQDTIREALAICLPRMQSKGILVLGGIHQSEEMKACWKEVQKDDRTKLTLDFFEYGLAFFSYSGTKTHLFLGV
jgi:predicted O-methyltransferase YrrM